MTQHPRAFGEGGRVEYMHGMPVRSSAHVLIPGAWMRGVRESYFLNRIRLAGYRSTTYGRSWRRGAGSNRKGVVGGSGGAVDAVLGDLRAMPHAPGYTDYNQRTIGGGQIITVSSLAESGVNTLQAAGSTAGEADIIFSIGGDSSWGSGTYTFSNGNKRVHGYTAPRPFRILFTSEATGIVADAGAPADLNVSLSHLMFRAQWTQTDETSDNVRTLDANNVLYEYCSFAFASDSILDLNDDANGVTFYRCLIGPGTTYSDKGCLLYTANNEFSSVQDIAFIENLWSYIGDRCPMWKHGASYYFVNNVWYNCPKPTGVMYGTANWGPPGQDRNTRAIVRGNMYIQGPDDADNITRIRYTEGTWTGHQDALTQYFYANDNQHDENGAITNIVNAETGEVVFEGDPADVYNPGGSSPDTPFTQPFENTILAATAAEANVTTKAGAWPAGDPASGGNREAVDKDVMDQMALGTSGSAKAAMPSLSARGSDTHDLSALSAAGWNEQAPGEAEGWRVFDVDVQTYRQTAQGFLGS